MEVVVSRCPPPYGIPNSPLRVEITAQHQHFEGIFQAYMRAIPVSFMPHKHVVWKLQNRLIIACKTGHFVRVWDVSMFDDTNR
jgi:hypothetical protein